MNNMLTTYLRYVVTLVLVALFASQMMVQISKYLQFDRTYDSERVFNKTMLWPSVTLCHTGGDDNTDNFDNVTRRSLKFDDLITNFSHSCRDPSAGKHKSKNVTTADFSNKDIFKRYIIPNPDQSKLMGCITYNPPGSSNVGFRYPLKATLDIRKVTAWWVFLHRKHYFVANHGEMFGSTFLYLPSELMAGQPEGAYRNEVHAISYRKSTFMETDDSWCDSRGHLEMDLCLREYLENEKLKCRIPPKTSNNSMPQCTGSALEFINMYQNFEEEGELRLTNGTGCIPDCTRYSYSTTQILSQSMNVRDEVRNDTMWLTLYYATGNYNSIKEAWSYDWGSLCSDVGGFMGLLLGWSIITFYDGLIEMMKGVQNVFIKVQMKK